MGTEPEAFRWEGGARGTTTIEDLHAAGVPAVAVTDHDLRPTGRLMLTNRSKSATEVVEPGDYIVEAEGGWARTSSLWPEHEDAALLDPLNGPHEPLPGLYRLLLQRAGYRRWDVTAATWEWRHDGLTVDEMRAGKWEPIYTVAGFTTDAD